MALPVQPWDRHPAHGALVGLVGCDPVLSRRTVFGLAAAVGLSPTGAARRRGVLWDAVSAPKPAGHLGPPRCGPPGAAVATAR